MSRSRLGFNEHGILEWLAEPPHIVMGGPSLNVSHYRIRDDDLASPDSTPTWLGNLDSNPTSSIGTGTSNSFVIRIQLDETNNKSGTWASLQLNYDYNSGTATGTVGSASSYVRMYGATSRGGIADNTAITVARLTAPTGTFDNGVCDTADGTGSYSTGSNGAWTEYEWIVYIVDADVSNADTIQLNLTGQDATGVTWPVITVSKAAPPISESRTDGAKATDAASGIWSGTMTRTDGAKGTDTATAIGTFPRAGSEGADLSDEATGNLAKFEEVTDGAELSDSAADTMAFFETPSEGAELSDAATDYLYHLYQETGSDGADLTDTAVGTVSAGVFSACTIIFGG